MNKIKKIGVVTGARSDYGLLYWVMKEIKENSEMELIPLVTGSHLSKKFGYTMQEIIDDGFKNLVEIKISTDDLSPYGIAKAMSQGVRGFAEYFKSNPLDFLLVLGDRFEILAAALAALPYNLVIGHLGGGEISAGAIDDSIRHCLTKLSHFHFPITAECAERIKKMGEEPWRIKVVGSPRLDFINKVRFKSKEVLAKEFKINFSGRVALVIYHPVTLEFKDAENQINNLLTAIDKLGIETVLIYPSFDTRSDVIISKIKKFARRNPKVKLFKNFERDDYLSILNSVDVFIGNSSSGLIEAPSFGLPVVNIGNRQKGRDQINNVINVGYSSDSIVKGAGKALSDKEFIKSLESLTNPFGDGSASKKVVKFLSKIDLDDSKINRKIFNQRS